MKETICGYTEPAIPKETAATEIIHMAEKRVARLSSLVAEIDKRLERVCMLEHPEKACAEPGVAGKDELPPYFNELKAYFDSVASDCARLENILSRLGV